MFTAAHTQESSPQALTGNSLDQRSTRRRLLELPAWIMVYTVNSRHKYVAMVRDMTRSGIYFCCDFSARVGEEIDFILKFPRWTKAPALACKGEVVRVEQRGPGARAGMALRLNRYTVCR